MIKLTGGDKLDLGVLSKSLPQSTAGGICLQGHHNKLTKRSSVQKFVAGIKYTQLHVPVANQLKYYLCSLI